MKPPQKKDGRELQEAPEVIALKQRRVSCKYCREPKPKKRNRWLLEQPTAPRTQPKERLGSMDQKLSILIADDEARLRRIYTRALKNHHVIAVDGLTSARKWVEEGNEPDIVISDYMMPDGDGLDVLEMAATLIPKALRFLATGTPHEVAHKAIELSAGIFTKGTPQLQAFLSTLNEQSRLVFKMKNVAIRELQQFGNSTSESNWYRALPEDEQEKVTKAAVDDFWESNDAAGVASTISRLNDLFRGELSHEQKPALDWCLRIQSELRTLDSINSFNTGVSYGYHLGVVARGFEASGFTKESVSPSPESLFRISRWVTAIACELGN